jgi:Kef-type K+ transport system membrane component KefB
MGWGIMRAWGDTPAESLFVGAALVATSVGITAQVLASRNLLSHKASKVILAAAVIDDVLGLIILAVVSSVSRGEVKILELLSAAALAIGFIVVVAFWGTKAVTTVVPKVEQQLGAGEVQFNLAMVLLFGMFVLAVLSGVAGIIGAFLAGMALAPTITHRVHDLTQGVTELLVPFFLAGIGLHLNLKVYADPEEILICIVITAAAVASKFLGCGLGALSLGMKDAIRIGTGMVPRGEVGMVVAQIGMTAGVVSEKTYAVVVFMAVMTTIVAPPMLKAAFRGASVEPLVES